MLYETERLIVSRARGEDIDPLLDIVADPIVMRQFAHGGPWYRITRADWAEARRL